MKREDVKKLVQEGYAMVAKNRVSCCAPSNSCCGGNVLAEDISKK